MHRHGETDMCLFMVSGQVTKVLCEAVFWVVVIVTLREDGCRETHQTVDSDCVL